jgi:hypothetical protein
MGVSELDFARARILALLKERAFYGYWTQDELDEADREAKELAEFFRMGARI